MTTVQDSIIRLNVGGIHYTTTRSTLCAVPNSMLARMFSGTVVPTRLCDKDGCYFIDRDGKLFQSVLTFLRTQNITCTKRQPPDLVLQELEYFGLIPQNSVNIPVRWESLWRHNVWHSALTQSTLLASVLANPRAYLHKREETLQLYAAPTIIEAPLIEKVRTLLEQRLLPQKHPDAIDHVFLTRLTCLSRMDRLYTCQIAVPTKYHQAMTRQLTCDTYTKTLSAWFQRQFKLPYCEIMFINIPKAKPYAWPRLVLDVHDSVYRPPPEIRHGNSYKWIMPPFHINVSDPEVEYEDRVVAFANWREAVKPYKVASCLTITFKPPKKS